MKIKSTLTGFGLRLLPALFFTLPVASFAHGNDKTCQHASNGNIEFTENKTQWDRSVKFVTDLKGARVFLQQQSITFALYDYAMVDEIQHRKSPADKNEKVNAHAYKLKFLNSNSNALVSGSEKTAGYKNYFIGNDPSKWASHVQSYQVLSYNDLYPKTDLVLYEQQGQLKYEYILEPGANPASIKMQYDGIDGIAIKNGELHLQTSINTVVEQKPYVYQVVAGKKKEIASRFTLKNNTVSFEFPNGYNTALPLVIDPTMVFSTYSGSSAGNYGYTAAFDDLGFVYSGGIVFGPGFPVTTGAYQISHEGATDSGLIKYNPNATTGAQSRVWATYLGGNSSDNPHSLVTNSNRELLVYGSSSSNDYPTTSGAYDNSHNGGNDIVVSKLSFDGSTLLGSTFLGGADSEGQTASSLNQNYGDAYRGDITVDALDNVYFASTSASSNFPIVNGFQNTKATGYDAVVCKLSSDLTSIIWSTFLGGNGDDCAYSVQVTNLLDVVVAGGTKSDDLPGTNGAAYPGFQGVTDAFAARILHDGSGLVRATYTGTDEYDQAYFVQLDAQDNVYLFGQTMGDYPVSLNVYRNLNSGQFIHKLSPTLTTSFFSTVIGNGNGAMNISPTAFLVDDCGQILLSGFGGGFGPSDISNMPVTPDAYQQTVGGFYIMQLAPNADSLKYATYISTLGAHVDGGTSRFDKKGNIYQSSCVSGGWPITPNAWSPTNQGGYNNGTLKMAITELDSDFTVKADSTSSTEITEGCAPLTLHFKRVSNGGQFYYWHFGNGADTMATGPVSHTFTEPGVFTVTHYLFDSTTCQGSSMATKTITVHGPTGTAGPDKAICNSASTQLDGGGGVTYLWSPAAGLSATNVANPVATPTVTTAYSVTVTNQWGCSNTDTVIVGVGELPDLVSPGTLQICPGDSILVSVGSNPDYNYSWSPGLGLSNNDSSSVIAFPQVTTTYSVDVTYDGCATTEIVTINVNPVPALVLTPNVVTCLGVPANLTAQGALSYAWTPDTGLDVATGNSVMANPPATTTYTVTGTSADGCTSVGTITVEVGSLQATATNNGPYCAGDSVVLSASIFTGATYQWTGPNGFSSQAQSPVITNAPSFMSGDYTVVVVAQGCQSEPATTVVEIYSVPDLQVSSDKTICEGENTMLSAGGATFYSWTPANGLDLTNTDVVQASPQVSTTYTITGYHIETCPTFDTVTVFVNPAIVATPLTNVALCPDEETTLSTTQNTGYTYAWSPTNGLSDSTISNPIAKPTETTEYTLTITEGACSLTYTALVTVGVPPVVSAIADYTTGPAPHTVQFSNTSTGATSQVWHFGDGGTSTEVSPVHTYAAAGEYQVTLVSDYGDDCSQTDTIETIIVTPAMQTNIITPNGDGHNDEFVFNATKKPFTLYIMNRWGKVVKEAENYHQQQNWKAEGLPDGLYFYLIETNDGESWKGWLEVIR